MKRIVPALAAAGLLLLLCAVPASALAASPTLVAVGSAAQVGSIVIPAGTVHNGDIDVSAGNVTVEGTVRGNVSVALGQVEVSGRVTGRVSVGMGQIVLAKGARVGNTSVGMGQIQTLGPGVPLPVPPSTVTHTTVISPRIFGHWPTLPIAWGTAGPSVLLFRVFWWLAGLAVVLILAGAYPRGLETIERDFLKEPVSGFAWGFLLLLCAFPASVILMLTIVGIPLVLLLWLGLVAAKVLGFAALSLYVGREILHRFNRTAPSTGVMAVVGTAAFLIVGTVPLLGWLLGFVVACAGVGVAARTGFGSGRPWFRRPNSVT